LKNYFNASLKSGLYPALEICRWPMLYKSGVQGRRRSGKAGGDAVKELRTMETYKKQTNRCQLCLFLFISIVDLKNNSRYYI